MTKNRLIFASAVLTIAIAGCGGGSNKALSYSAFGKKADKICQDAENENKALGKTTTSEATPENGALIGKLVDIVQKQRDKIDGLNAPDQLKQPKDDFVSVTDQQIELAKKAGDAANAKDQPGYESAIKELQALSPKGNAAGSKLGAPACAK
jgi:hypothetical protein